MRWLVLLIPPLCPPYGKQCPIVRSSNPYSRRNNEEYEIKWNGMNVDL